MEKRITSNCNRYVVLPDIKTSPKKSAKTFNEGLALPSSTVFSNRAIKHTTSENNFLVLGTDKKISKKHIPSKFNKSYEKLPTIHDNNFVAVKDETKQPPAQKQCRPVCHRLSTEKFPPTNRATWQTLSTGNLPSKKTVWQRLSTYNSSPPTLLKPLDNHCTLKQFLDRDYKESNFNRFQYCQKPHTKMLAQALFSGIEYLHQQHIAHLSIEPDSIKCCISVEGNVTFKLSDLSAVEIKDTNGLIKHIPEKKLLDFTSPEATVLLIDRKQIEQGKNAYLANRIYDSLKEDSDIDFYSESSSLSLETIIGYGSYSAFKADVWSVGMVVLQAIIYPDLLYPKLQGLTDNALYCEKLVNDYTYHSYNIVLNILFSPDNYTLQSALLTAIEPIWESRASANQIMKKLQEGVEY